MNFLWISAAVAAADQLTKAWVRARLVPGESVALWPPWLYMTYVENEGAAFGLFRTQGAFLIVVAVGVWIAAIAGRRQLQQQPALVRWGAGLGLGGTAGNLIDRLSRGAVVDFIDVRVWPVFNVADAAIVLGAGLLIVSTLRSSARGS